MLQDVQALTEKEKHTLRLLLAGHDAKSMARHLGLSVHTVNERLRDARRKLSVSSSKEAARRLREAEGPSPDPFEAPYSFGDEPIGAAPAAPAGQPGEEPGASSVATPRGAWAIGVIAMISLGLALLVFTASPGIAPDGAPAPAPAAHGSAAAETGATRAAEQWLALVDAGKWEESWAATGRAFRSQNSVAAWRAASEAARVPLGAVLSRRASGEESIPAPPAGLQLVRFRTDFAGKAGAVETLTLAREEGGWRVAGYFIE